MLIFSLMQKSFGNILLISIPFFLTPLPVIMSHIRECTECKLRIIAGTSHNNQNNAAKKELIFYILI